MFLTLWWNAVFFFWSMARQTFPDSAASAGIFWCNESCSGFLTLRVVTSEMWWKILHKWRRTRRLDWRQLSNLSIFERLQEQKHWWGARWWVEREYWLSPSLHATATPERPGLPLLQMFSENNYTFFVFWFVMWSLPNPSGQRTRNTDILSQSIFNTSTCKKLLPSFVLPSCLWPWTWLDCHQDWLGPWLGWCWYRLGGDRKGWKTVKDERPCAFLSQPWPVWTRQSGRFSTSPQDSRPLWWYVQSLFSL